MMPAPHSITTELILGGQKSGKSRRAELLARDWLAQSADHRAVLIATGEAWDDEMRERIARHQRDRAERVPGLQTVEEPHDVAAALARLSTPQTLLVVDCLTLWLSNLLASLDPADETRFQQERTALLDALPGLQGHVVLVSNEVGMGIVPMGELCRRYCDEAGRLHQDLGRLCDRVTLMVAGLPLIVKGSGA